MDAKAKTHTEISDRELKMTRVIDAPREKIWDAMTIPEQMVQWWGPNGFRNTIEHSDVREGGYRKYVMHGPDGVNYPNYSRFVEIVKPEKLVYDHAGHEKGHLFRATVTLEKAEGNKTKVTMSLVFDTREEYEKVAKFAVDGGKQHLNRMNLFVTGQVIPFVIMKKFDAPREMVWKCWTDPEHMKWWGPKGSKAVKAEMDFRVGGSYFYGLDYMGHTIWGKQVYREIMPTSRLVFVSQFSDEKGGMGRHPMSPTWPAEMLTTIDFITLDDGKTLVSIEWVPINATKEETAMFDAGRDSMRGGWSGSFDVLADYLKTASYIKGVSP